MLIKIREKAQGVFAWVILILICVPFALWGIQNYVDVGKEIPVATVGDKEFFQRDVNIAFQQYSQQLARFNMPEAALRVQALEKLIRDEVLLQFVQDEGLVVTDETAREYIKELQYFQTDGAFDKKQYKSLLASQGMTSSQFVNRIRNAIIMEQFQRSVTDSSFATQYDVDGFFKIQNQQRNVEYLTVALEQVKDKPSEDELKAYYQQHQQDYKTEEQVAIEYVELALQELASKVEPTEEQLQAYYEEQKDLHTSKERRRISHILFAFNADDGQDDAALEKALAAQQRLQTENFEDVAKELSEDKGTAEKGGDLGLFNVGVMEPSFEDAATSLGLGEVSDPVKSAFGYHLIKVTELVPAEVKSFVEVSEEVSENFKKSSAENTFYQVGETLTEVSYENSDSLLVVSEATGLEIKKISFFTLSKGEGIAADQSIRTAAFSEEVLQGNNSEPVELGTDRLVVLRMLEHRPAAVRELQKVRGEVEKEIIAGKAREQTLNKAEKIKQRIQAGEDMQKVVAEHKLEVKKFPALKRNDRDIPWQLQQAIFKAAKPVEGELTTDIIGLPTGEQVVFNLLGVNEGEVLADDKKQLELTQRKIARTLGQSDLNAVISSLQADADIFIKKAEEIK